MICHLSNINAFTIPKRNQLMLLTVITVIYLLLLIATKIPEFRGV